MKDGSFASIDEINDLLKKLFPICRSITGDGVRQSLIELNKISPFDFQEIPSGTQVFDWVIPDEWLVEDAYIETIDGGQRVIDFRANNLHLVSYSVPFSGELTFKELVPHLHYLQDQPTAIPYRTSYYQRNWGFCLSYSDFLKLDQSKRYKVVVKTSLKPGNLTFGEIYLPGASGKEFLIHTYCCHPSMGNDNLSGMILWALVLRYIASIQHRHGYRFVIAPETIGALAFLQKHKDELKPVVGGLVLTTVAGPGPFSLKCSYEGHSYLDRVAGHVLSKLEPNYIKREFDVFGSDERQYSSPGFRIPMITISRSQYHHYQAYHTSLDDLEFVSAESLLASFYAYVDVLNVIEKDAALQSLSPFGEPMLGKRGLYPSIGGALKTASRINESDRIAGMLWTLFMADENNTLLDVAEKTGLSFFELYTVAKELQDNGLLRLDYGSAR